MDSFTTLYYINTIINTHLRKRLPVHMAHTGTSRASVHHSTISNFEKYVAKNNKEAEDTTEAEETNKNIVSSKACFVRPAKRQSSFSLDAFLQKCQKDATEGIRLASLKKMENVNQ